MAGVVRCGRRVRRTIRTHPPAHQAAAPPGARPTPISATGAMSPANPEAKSEKASGTGLTFPQILASALAAATAAILGSFLGVLGTIGGAALASIVSTVGSALYQKSLEATRDRVKQRLLVAGPGHTKVANVVGRVTGQAPAGGGPQGIPGPGAIPGQG